VSSESPPGASDPSLAEVLRALADEEPLERTAVRLGIPRARLLRILRGAASELDEGVPGPPPPAAAAATPPKTPDLFGKPAAGGRAIMYFDGASRGNPGPSGAGAVILDAGGKVVAEAGRFLGVQTNNVAEYQSAILGFETALQLGFKELDVRADSMLVVQQLKGEWKIKHPGLLPLWEKARALLAKFDRVTLRHVPRELNTLADEMSNRAIDERM
jgi:ribonuclease HI